MTLPFDICMSYSAYGRVIWRNMKFVGVTWQMSLPLEADQNTMK